MNLGQLIAQFRTETADAVQPYLWPDPELAVYASEAEEEAAIRKRLIRESTNTAICQIAVTAGKRVYQLNPLVLEIVYASMVYTGSPGMFPYKLELTEAATLDRVRPAWRSLTYRPGAIIHYDNTMEVDSIPDTDYTINLEVYRLPANPMQYTSDEPEINGVHHRHLVKWMKYRAYSKQDADTQDLKKSEQFRLEFEAVFGPPVDASYRKHGNANQPHRNVCW